MTCCSLRPTWTGLNILLMVVGFIIFWPLGLFMLAYMIWGRQWGLDLSDWGNVKNHASEAGDKVKRAFDGTSYSDRTQYSASTGNTAFDDWRAAELKRLEEERRKLEEARKEFEAYADELRRARDREEFERFKSRWEGRNRDSSGHHEGSAPETA